MLTVKELRIMVSAAETERNDAIDNLTNTQRRYEELRDMLNVWVSENYMEMEPNE